MIDVATEHIDLNVSMTLLQGEVLRRGWQMFAYYEDMPLFRLIRDDGKVLEIFSATPPTTSYAAGLLANDKYASCVLHQSHGLPVPMTYVITSDQQAADAAKSIIRAGHRYVVKPLDAGHGNGISTGLGTLGELPDALEFAQRFSTKVLIQEHISGGIDIRLLVIDGRFTAALRRQAAQVTGDGSSTIRQLIERENAKDTRGLNYSKPLNMISLPHAESYLGSRMAEVLEAGKTIDVVAVSNFGAGGETYDVTDQVPSWLRRIAEKAAAVSRLPVAGVDIMVAVMPTADTTIEQLNPKIIEINKCPSLSMHEKPTYGTGRPVVAAYVDYLASL